ncbi:unnamed protein product, partial [Mesorhabditis belari]|uniref:Uncharacterized protein n=1 Tax=Mesorhabditis belari TaxID=2138241 RepID=A0AAF3ELT1_9BILA
MSFSSFHCRFPSDLCKDFRDLFTQFFGMDSSTLLRVIHLILMLFSIAALCLTSAIFDFIIINRMYYTLPEKRVLVDEGMSLIFFISSSLLLFVSLCSLFFSQTSQNIQNMARKYECVLGFLHGFSLLSCTVVGALCTIKAIETAVEIFPFAYNAVPYQFEKASHWYYTRLVAVAIIFALSSLICLCEFLFLHCGIRFRQNTFTKLIPSTTKSSANSNPNSAQQRGLLYFS